MPPSPEEWIPALRELLSSQPLAVLSTQDRGQPHASLVAFAATGDLREVLFATPRATRKYAYLTSDNRAALLVDNRSNTPADFHSATAATVKGRVDEIPHEDKDRFLGPYLARHPHLTEFVRAPSCALMRLRVESYSIVRRFQEVVNIPVPP